jgi:hypothetical protein
VSVARPMGRSIQPNPDAPRCPGKNGAGTSPFPDATCRMNKRSRTGIPTWKKMCWGCSTGKPPPAPRPAPQPRPVQGQQLNAFGGLASTVSPTPIGRGNPGKRTKWDGTARQFPDPTSQEAIAYSTMRNGGKTRKYHPWSLDISRQFPCLHCVRNESRLNPDGSCVSDQYDPTHPCIGYCQCAEIACELCRRKNSVGRWPRELGVRDKGAGGKCGRRPLWVSSRRTSSSRSPTK